MDFVIDTNSPFNIITSPALYTLLETIGRRKILLPKRSIFMKNIAERFSEMKSKLVKLLSEQKYICVTCDVWSSRACSYLGKTVHFLSNEYQHYSYVLAFRKLKGNQTNLELATVIDEILNEFELPKEKITNIVTDGGSAFCKAFKEFGKNNDMLVEAIELDENDDNEDLSENATLRETPFMQNNDGELYYSNHLNFEPNQDENNSNESENEADFENDDYDLFRDLVQPNQTEQSTVKTSIDLPPQRRCLSHLLNLISSDFEKGLSSVVKTAFINSYNKLHALWVFTHRSSHARTICQKILGCLLLVPCETRWNSKYYAIERA